LKRIIALFAIVNLLLLSAAAAEKDFPTQQGFTIVLSDDWVEIPRNVLDDLSATMARMSSAPVQKWDYGYQLASATNWAQYPYILVQVKEEGRIRESELANYKKVSADMNEGLKKAEKSMDGILSDSTMGETVYDDQNHILFSTMQMNVRAIGPVLGVTAVKLTEKGAVQFMGYTLEKDASIYVPFYKKAAIDVRLPEDLVYKPRASDSGFDWSHVGRSAIIGGLVGGMIGLIRMFFKKKKTS